MSPDLVLDSAPDMTRILAKAPFLGGRHGTALPDLRVVRRGVTIDVVHLAEYAHLHGFSLGNDVPITYPHMIVSPLQLVVMSGDGFPMPMMGLVHLVNRIRQVRPVRVDDTLTATVQAHNLRAHPKGRLVDLVSSVEAGGEVVWDSVSTYLSRGPASEGEGRLDTPRPDTPQSDTPQPDTPPDTSLLADRAGGTLWRLAADTGRRYAAVSGDWNPIHLHALTARPLGFPTAIAHGMYTYARAMADTAPRVGTREVTSTVWFAKPVRLPSTVRSRSLVDAGRTLTLLSDRAGSIDHAVIENRW